MASLNRDIAKLAIPSILANITIPLVGLVDVAIAGHIADAAAIGGIAIGTMLFDLLYWNFGFLRVGTSGMTAQAFGRGDKNECAGQLVHALEIAIGGSLLIWLIQWLFVTAALVLVPCSEAVAIQARHYFFARVWAAPATLALFALKGWFIGMQDTIRPMVCDLVVNAVNMVASYVLAVYTHLGVVGVAWGTVIAQYAGLLVAGGLLLLKYTSFFRQVTTPLRVMLASFDKHIFTLNRNLFIRSICFMVVYIGYTSLSARYGDEELAVSNLVMKLFMLVSYFVDGFAFAGEALVGRKIGEKTGISSVVWSLHAWGMGVGVLFTVVFYFWGENMMLFFWPDCATAAQSFDYRPWLLAMPIMAVPAFLWDGIYVGATAGPQIRNAMILSAVAFVVIYLVLLYTTTLGIEAVLYAYFAHLVARDVYLTVIWKSTYRKIYDR